MKVVIILYILFYVQISYKNSTMEPILMTLPGCNILCPLDKFINLTRNAVPEDWERECLIGWEDISPSDVIGNYYLSVEYIFIYDLLYSIWCVYIILFLVVSAILTSSILMLVLLVLIIIGFIYWRHKREHGQYYFRLTYNDYNEAI